MRFWKMIMILAAIKKMKVKTKEWSLWKNFKNKFRIKNLMNLMMILTIMV